jgi:hypothetical protein
MLMLWWMLLRCLLWRILILVHERLLMLLMLPMGL